jgi:hypothetical protein
MRNWDEKSRTETNSWSQDKEPRHGETGKVNQYQPKTELINLRQTSGRKGSLLMVDIFFISLVWNVDIHRWACKHLQPWTMFPPSFAQERQILQLLRDFFSFWLSSSMPQTLTLLSSSICTSCDKLSKLVSFCRLIHCLPRSKDDARVKAAVILWKLCLSLSLSPSLLHYIEVLDLETPAGYNNVLPSFAQVLQFIRCPA